MVILRHLIKTGGIVRLLLPARLWLKIIFIFVIANQSEGDGFKEPDEIGITVSLLTLQLMLEGRVFGDDKLGELPFVDLLRRAEESFQVFDGIRTDLQPFASAIGLDFGDEFFEIGRTSRRMKILDGQNIGTEALNKVRKHSFYHPDLFCTLTT